MQYTDQNIENEQNPKHIKNINNDIFLKILSSYCTENSIDADLSQADWKYITSLAIEQGMACLLFKALENKHVCDNDSLERLNDYYQKALFACAARNESLLKISKAFEENHIDFVILKGAVIQGYYPSAELRVMSDIDFFIQSNERKNAKKILDNINIKFQNSNSYQDIYTDINGIIIEIHHELWGYDLDETELVSNIWDKKNLMNGRKHTYLLSDEDLYIFTIAHMFKHFKTSGIGIRPVFDIWYILKKTISNMDFSYIKKELGKFGASDFEKSIRHLVSSIFLGKEKTDKLIIIEEYLLMGKTHGTTLISSVNQLGNKGKVYHFFSRMFPPLSKMERRFQILKKIPFLLPFFWIWRIISTPFIKGRLDENINQVKNVDKINSNDKEFQKKVFDAAGIKSNEKIIKKKFNHINLFSLITLTFLILIFCIIFFQSGKISIFNDSSDEISKEEISSSEMTESDSSETDSSVENNPEHSENTYGTISWKGGIYTGYLKDNVPNGSGEHVVENYIKYVGTFVDGYYEGIGKIEYSDGSYYRGNFKNNQSNGEGTLYCANGDIIHGTFTDGKPGGVCNYEYSDGNLFIGTMVNGLKHGEGTFHWLNGDKYTGSFVSDMRDGYGVLEYANGDKYKGNWSQGFCSGYGEYTWANGKKYEGKFENGIMNDVECKISFPDGSVYTGEISDGIQHGKGTLTYINGDIAKGNFSLGYLSGEAEYYFAEKKLWIKVIYEKGVIIKYILK